MIGSSGISGWLASRPPRSTREGALIDQYQERYEEQEARIKRQDDRLDKQEDEIDELRASVRSLQQRDIAARNYMYELIRHIEEGAGPPPPEMPPELFR
jgi:septal ring factor EnvC (AmiA/AmiB activator)